METNGPIENNSKYICETCSYKCNKKSDWDKHINTKKHLGNTMETTNSHNTYTCNNCNKTYNNRSGLWKHKKKCNEITKENCPQKSCWTKAILIKTNIKESCR